ncbi:hypothetical protein NQ318_012006 [Aromia moschata]|uniref:DUF659 domain-containing protein n=1 Tax=Aromia moschata TaxID=1265417 RepID=A0AAV8Y6W4_9CUCU|nr:hypothetical protein NQ318_012006 [Aromia moschata]
MAQPPPPRSRVELWIKDIPELQFDGVDMYCKNCKKTVSWRKKCYIMRHLASAHHEKSITGSNNMDKQRNFNLDLVSAVVGSNIPWKKLNNPLFRQFLQRCVMGQYTNVKIPTESCLRKNYLSQTCENIRTNISSQLNGKYIWLGIDETINACGWRVANVLVGALEEDSPTRPHLIASKIIENPDPESITSLVHTSLKILWSIKFKDNCDKLLLLLTDVMPCIEDVGKILKEMYPNVIHIASFTHGLQTVAECVKDCYPDVEKLISNIQKVILDTPECKKQFRETLPNTPLPPEAIPTKCGTWIEAASYYYCNFDKVKRALQRLEAPGISKTQRAFTDPTIRENLAFIHANFSQIHLTIGRLNPGNPSASKLTLVDAMNIVFDLRNYLFRLPGSIAKKVKEKLEAIVKENPGFPALSHIADLLMGKEVDTCEPVCLRNFKYFKYAPLACVDVELSFPDYKWIFDEKRRNLSAEHLEQTLIIQFYSNETLE